MEVTEMANLAYLRVSTDEQAESGLGLEAQLAAIRKAVGEPDAVFRDEGISGSKANRPGLLAALEALGEGDALVVAKRDRLARDTYLALWIEKEAKKRGAQIHSAAGEGNGNDPAAQLMRTLVDAFATYERQQIGIRTAAALERKRAKGEKTGGDVPFGFSLSEDGIHLEANEREQEALAIIRELRERGYALRAICEELEARGVQTKRGGKKWNSGTVQRILKRAA
jgi:site-specific DNA recombinase